MPKYDGLVKNTNLKFSDKICPRCQSKSVNKNARRCDNCKGILLWDGDDAKFAIERRDGWYLWHKTVFGIEGWFSQNYWDITYSMPK